MASNAGAVLVVGTPEVIDVVEEPIRSALSDRAVLTATDVPTAFERLESAAVDCVASSLEVPNAEGIEHLQGVTVAEGVTARDRSIPVVLFTTTGHEDASKVAIEAGAESHILRCSTDRKLAELSRRIEQLAERRRAERRADRHARINEVLRDVNETLVRASTQEAVARGVCRQLVKAAPKAHAVFCLRDDGIDIQAEMGSTEASVSVEDLDAVVESAGPNGRFYADPGSMPVPVRTFARTEGYGSLMAFPVSFREECYGTVVVFADEADTFDASQLTVFCELGRTIGYALSAVETRTQLARQNDRLDEFARMVSHDLRNPLTVIDGRLELARTSDDPEHFDAISRATDRMETLIDDMLRQARDTESEDVRPVSLAAVASRAWQQVTTGAATMSFADDCTIRADPGRLQQVFENIFRNSVEHGSTGSRTQSGDAVEHGSTTPHSRGANPQARSHGDGIARPEAAGDDAPVSIRVGSLQDGFYVEDDGPGVPSEQRRQIFEYGYTTSADGTGYGLAIVERVVSDHGWAVGVTDSEHAASGARFEITGVERTN
jgi:signal transduction histidine kinase/CheY-like chemotaxis protein